MGTIKITVKPQDNLFIAESLVGGCQREGLGANPNEALGACIRSLWEAKAFDNLVTLVLNVTEVKPARFQVERMDGYPIAIDLAVDSSEIRSLEIYPNFKSVEDLAVGHATMASDVDNQMFYIRRTD